MYLASPRKANEDKHQAQDWLMLCCPKMQADIINTHEMMQEKPAVHDAGKHNTLLLQCCKYPDVLMFTVSLGQGDVWQ